MVACEVGEWTIEVRTQPVPATPRGTEVVFSIDNVNGVNISGQARELGGPHIGTFTGTCRAVLQGRLHIMTFEFAWGAVNVSLAGVTFPDGVNRFLGRFRATARTQREGAAAGQATAEEAGGRAATVRPPVLPPDDGDTGTSNGQQT